MNHERIVQHNSSPSLSFHVQKISINQVFTLDRPTESKENGVK